MKRRCSWTAGWNEIMLLFEIANPCVWAREVHGVFGRKRFPGGRKKEVVSFGQPSPFPSVGPLKKKRREIYFQISYCASSGILYRISRSRLPSLRLTLVNLFHACLSPSFDWNTREASDGPSSPASPPTRVGKRVSWRWTGAGYGTSISIADKRLPYSSSLPVVVSLPWNESFGNWIYMTRITITKSSEADPLQMLVREVVTIALSTSAHRSKLTSPSFPPIIRSARWTGIFRRFSFVSRDLGRFPFSFRCAWFLWNRENTFCQYVR